MVRTISKENTSRALAGYSNHSLNFIRRSIKKSAKDITMDEKQVKFYQRLSLTNMKNFSLNFIWRSIRKYSAKNINTFIIFYQRLTQNKTVNFQRSITNTSTKDISTIDEELRFCQRLILKTIYKTQTQNNSFVGSAYFLFL